MLRDDWAAVSTLAACIRAMVPDARLVTHGPRIECFYFQIGERVCLRLMPGVDQSDPTPAWVLSIVLDDEVFPFHSTNQPAEAVTSFIWAGRMLRSRFCELQDLLATGVIPRCVNNCGDLHNFVDWNMAGDAEKLIEAGEQISFDAQSGSMAWPCSILSAVDRVIGWWLAHHVEPSLAPGATAKQMAGLLGSSNPALEQQVVERFLQMSHNDAREFLHHAAGHDGSNLTTKVMAMVRAAAMQSHLQS
jgi:hypothetical protein